MAASPSGTPPRRDPALQAREARSAWLRAMVEDEADQGRFQVSRHVFSDPELFELELTHIFEGTWIFIGLESQIPNPHDFVTLHMGRRPVLLMRDGDGRVAAFYNTCRHRGAVLAPDQQGNKRVHVCRYHAWAYDSTGRNVNVANEQHGQLPPCFAQQDRDLVPIARIGSYRGFIFGSLNPDVPPLQEHLGQACKFLDLVADQSPQGVEYVPGNVTYTYEGNWKLQVENGLDFYHFASTHASYMDVMQHRTKAGTAEPGRTYEPDGVQECAGSWGLGNGHAMMYAIRKQGRVHIRPLASDPGAMQEIRSRVSEDDARWMLRQRNLTIFPNLQIVDISAQQLRTWRPLAPGRTEMVSHCLAPVGEGDAARALRIRNYEDFFNPTGLGASDDNLMYEFVQAGYEASDAGPLLGYLRGLGPPLVEADPHAHELGLVPETWAWGPVSFGDETCFHGVYRQWLQLLQRGEQRRAAASSSEVPA